MSFLFDGKEMRQIVLDTETTGIEISQGNRILEIGCVEMISRRVTGNNFHVYINPERASEEGALEVHGITEEFLADKPLFHEIVDDFIQFIDGAQLIIHNAPFDVGFLDNEFKLLNSGKGNIADYCSVLDTLEMAKKKFPGQKNNLDALCRRYDIDNSRRTLHGALLDSEILADVYLAMTGGQVSLSLSADGSEETEDGVHIENYTPVDREGLSFAKVYATDDEIKSHEEYLDLVAKKCGGDPVWRK